MNRCVRTFGSVQTKPAVAYVHYAPRFCLGLQAPRALALVAYERGTRREGSGGVSCRLQKLADRSRSDGLVLGYLTV